MSAASLLPFHFLNLRGDPRNNVFHGSWNIFIEQFKYKKQRPSIQCPSLMPIRPYKIIKEKTYSSDNKNSFITDCTTIRSICKQIHNSISRWEILLQFQFSYKITNLSATFKVLPNRVDLEAITSMGCTYKSFLRSWTAISHTFWRENLFLQIIRSNTVRLSKQYITETNRVHISQPNCYYPSEQWFNEHL